jgi:thiamine biosynthesis protein ThiI
MPTLLVRYGELGLKSPSVRKRFENALVDDIRRRHALEKVPCVISQTRGRLFVDSDDWRRSCEILTRTFGVVSFSPVERVSIDIEELTKATIQFARPILFPGASFAIRSRRSGNHPYTSQTLAEKLGEAVLNDNAERGVKVKLDAPDIEISVEVRERDSFLFSSVLTGPGGMPLGTQGRLLSILDSELAIASTWLMMKRGCSVLVAGKERYLLEVLEKWYPNLKSIEPGKNIFDVANNSECIGIALPWTLIEIEKNGAPKGDLPVFYPLVGMNEKEIERLLARIRA